MRLGGCLKAVLTSTVISLGWVGAANAEALAIAGETENDWRFSLTPYLFLPVQTKGTSTVGGVEADLDLSLSEVLDLLQGAASIRGEAWNGDWGVIADLYYVEIEAKGGAAVGPASQSYLDAKVTTRQTWFNLMGAYRFAQGETGPVNRRWALDASAGVRWNTLKQTVDATLTLPPPDLSQDVSLGGTEEWFEPVIGLRGAWEVAERWTLGARVDLGGFGVNGDKLQYLVLGGADWRPWEKVSFKLGWQFYGIDYETERSDGKFAYDVDQNGPYLGLTFRF